MAAAEPNIVAKKIGAEIESRTCRDIVAVILGKNRYSIYRVFHEGMESIWRIERRHIDSNRTIIVSGKKNFLSPIAKEVCNQIRAPLRRMIRMHPLGCANRSLREVLDNRNRPTFYRVIANERAAGICAARHIALPPNAKSQCRIIIIFWIWCWFHIALVCRGGIYSAMRAGKKFHAWRSRVDIHRMAASCIHRTMGPEMNPPRLSIKKRDAVRWCFMAGPNLQPPHSRRALNQVHCVAMPHACRVQSLAIVIYDHVTVDYFVAAIEIDIADS